MITVDIFPTRRAAEAARRSLVRAFGQVDEVFALVYGDAFLADPENELRVVRLAPARYGLQFDDPSLPEQD